MALGLLDGMLLKLGGADGDTVGNPVGLLLGCNDLEGVCEGGALGRSVGESLGS
jgi:hypothetical protein